VGIVANGSDRAVGHDEVDYVVVQAAKGPLALLIGVPARRARAARAIGKRSWRRAAEFMVELAAFVADGGLIVGGVSIGPESAAARHVDECQLSDHQSV